MEVPHNGHLVYKISSSLLLGSLQYQGLGMFVCVLIDSYISIILHYYDRQAKSELLRSKIVLLSLLLLSWHQVFTRQCSRHRVEQNALNGYRG
jgi:hypothetical protein